MAVLRVGQGLGERKTKIVLQSLHGIYISVLFRSFKDCQRIWYAWFGWLYIVCMFKTVARILGWSSF